MVGRLYFEIWLVIRHAIHSTPPEMDVHYVRYKYIGAWMPIVCCDFWDYLVFKRKSKNENRSRPLSCFVESFVSFACSGPVCRKIKNLNGSLNLRRWVQLVLASLTYYIHSWFHFLALSQALLISWGLIFTRKEKCSVCYTLQSMENSRWKWLCVYPGLQKKYLC